MTFLRSEGSLHAGVVVIYLPGRVLAAAAWQYWRRKPTVQREAL